jgi:hypothetical protein
VLASAPLGNAERALTWANPQAPAISFYPNAGVVADFNGDGIPDLAVANSSGDTLTILLGNGDGTFTAVASSPQTGNDPYYVVAGDFNGDCRSDILWRNSSSEEAYVWLMNGTSILNQGSPGGPSSAWVIEGVGDFNGDGMSDILWQNSSTGEVYIWLINGTSIANQGSPGTVSPSSGWVIAGVGDFNGDGKADILWQNSTSGEIYIWLMNGTAIASQGSPGAVSASSGWVIQGAGDFDGNGTSDILWRNSSSGEIYIWFMSGTTITNQGSPGTVSTGWGIKGAGDYNGDGKTDILWQNSTSGEVYIWEMNGLTITSQGSPGTVSSPWQISTLSP